MDQQLQQARERLGILENRFDSHVKDHERFEAAITENTQLTRNIAENTQELVDLVKGAKGLRSFVIWATPLAAAILVIWAWIKAQARL